MKKRLIAITLAIILTFTYCIYQPNIKKAYAIGDGTTIQSPINILEAFILVTMGFTVTIPTFDKIQEQFHRDQIIAKWIAEGVKDGAVYLTEEVAEAYKLVARTLKENGTIAIDIRTELNLEAIPDTIIDKLFSYSGRYILLWTKDYHANDNSRWIGVAYNFTNTVGVINAQFQYVYRFDKETSTWTTAGSGTYQGTWEDFSYYDRESTDLDISEAMVNVADIPTSTIFPKNDDLVTEISIPETFPIVTLDDLVGSTTEDFPIEVGVGSYPYGSDEDVDSTTYPWYYPLTKWFKKSIDSIGALPKSIADSISKVLNPSITTEQQETLKDSFISKTPIGDLQEIWDSIEDMTTERGAPPVINIPVGKLWRASTGIGYPLGQEEYTLIDFGYINANVIMPILNMGIIDFLRSLLSAGWYYITLMYIWHKIIPKEVIR